MSWYNPLVIVVHVSQVFQTFQVFQVFQVALLIYVNYLDHNWDKLLPKPIYLFSKLLRQ